MIHETEAPQSGSVTVGELRELLEGYGDHLPVELYDDTDDIVHEVIDSVEGSNVNGELRVTISFSHE